MAVTPDAPDSATKRRPSLTETLAVYCKRRVLIVLLLGFSSGLPIMLVSSTLQAWMTKSGITVKTIGLFNAVLWPYTLKFLWAPRIDALDVPVLSRVVGRRRGWLLLSQLVLMATIAILGLCDPGVSALIVAVAALIVATASATQDIVIDTFRIESLTGNEQPAGMASYVTGYRVAALVSGAGALLLVTGLRMLNLGDRTAWAGCYAVMAVLVLIGIVATSFAVEPDRSAEAEANHALHARENWLKRVFSPAIASFHDFMARDLAVGALVFVALFKLADALAFALLTRFVLGLGFTLAQVGTVRNGVGFVAAVLGGFAGGFVARALSLSASLWVGGILQTIMILAFCWQAVVGVDLAILAVTTSIESFADAVGTVVFVVYISALCKNPLYTATQFALLTAISSIGRNVVSLGTGYLEDATGWIWFFIICAAAGSPALAMLAWLQKRGHFEGLSVSRQ
jgi:PAT family beta-lactamase induction signal transducer AmpG